MKIQASPKKKSAIKFIIMKMLESMRVTEYIERMILSPTSDPAINDHTTIKGVTPSLPCPRDIVSTPPKFINAPTI